MFVPHWLHQLQRSLFPRQSAKSRNARRRPSAHLRVRPCLEPLEDRLAPSADLVNVSAVGASTPYSESTQSLTLTANVTDATNPSTKVNEGTVTFTVKDSGGNTIGTAQGTVSNGLASTSPSFTLPAREAVGKYTINVSYSDTPDNFTDNGTDTPATLAVSAAPTTTTASNVTTAFSTSAQTVTLNATVTSSSGIVNEGTVTFTILQGATVISTATSGTVSNGSTTAECSLPAGTGAGTYTIEANYSDSGGSFADSSDDSHTLNVTSSTAASTTTTASNATATFNTSSQTVKLTATVTSSAGTVNEGTVNFTILQGTTVIGTANSGAVSNGSATVSYALPAGTAPGTYAIEADYNDNSGAFALSSDTAHTLTVSAASTTTAASSATATFNTSSQTVKLTATVTSSAGTVNEGSVQFTLTDSNGNTIGTATSESVSNGSASVSYALPAGTAVGSYTIEAAYSDSSGNFASSSDNTHKLSVSAASTTTTAGNTTATFSTSAQNVTLTATVTSSAGTVNEGSVTFTLVDNNGNTIGTGATSAVTNGSASVNYSLPAGTAVGSYTIEAAYNDSASNFSSSFDNTHTLTVNTATATKVGLTTININPNLVNGTAQVTLTAQVSNAGGTVNEGVLSFTVAGVSGHANVVNGTASVQLALPFLSVTGGFRVALSYTDNGSTASFGDSQATQSVSTNVWNALLPAKVTFDSSNETMQFTVASQPLFGASYSTSTGLLSQVSLSSLSMPVSYVTTGNSVVASVGGVPWGMILYNTDGQFVGTASVTLGADGTPMWFLSDANGQPAGELPYGS
jgi:trimeric autotransporter adhesin